MNWERMTEKLANILDAPVTIDQISLEQWQAYDTTAGAGDNVQASKSVRREEDTIFLLQQQGDKALMIRINRADLSPAEQALIELMIESGKEAGRSRACQENAVDKPLEVQLRDWIINQLAAGALPADVPESLARTPLMRISKIPLLLTTDKALQGRAPYEAFKRLLKQFFDAEIVLLALDNNEWLILAAKELLNEESSANLSDLEEELTAIAMGLHEMLVAEWNLDGHISIDPPIVPAEQVISSILRMREATQVGRLFHVGNHVHLPWKLHLESLLYSIPDDRKTKFLKQMFAENSGMIELELLTTLNRFFDLDCNVSETAKDLYIHRNTLLYRLDKFKQETGFDVRTFRDAVLVKIAIDLYNVTKRNR